MQILPAFLSMYPQPTHVMDNILWCECAMHIMQMHDVLKMSPILSLSSITTTILYRQLTTAGAPLDFHQDFSHHKTTVLRL